MKFKQSSYLQTNNQSKPTNLHFYIPLLMSKEATLDFNDLALGYNYEIKGAYLNGLDTNLYLRNVNVINKPPNASLPFKQSIQ